MEVFAVRFVGGPQDGTKFVRRADLDWPPPPRLEVGGSNYVLDMYSQFPDDVAAKAGVMRGAQYLFDPAQP